MKISARQAMQQFAQMHWLDTDLPITWSIACDFAEWYAEQERLSEPFSATKSKPINTVQDMKTPAQIFEEQNPQDGTIPEWAENLCKAYAEEVAKNTERRLFAAMAMQAYIDKVPVDSTESTYKYAWSVADADALIAELDKPH